MGVRKKGIHDVVFSEKVCLRLASFFSTFESHRAEVLPAKVRKRYEEEEDITMRIHSP